MITLFYSIIVLKQIDISINTSRILLSNSNLLFVIYYPNRICLNIYFIFYFYTKPDIRVNSLNKILFYKNRLRKNFLFCNYIFFSLKKIKKIIVQFLFFLCSLIFMRTFAMSGYDELCHDNPQCLPILRSHKFTYRSLYLDVDKINELGEKRQNYRTTYFKKSFVSRRKHAYDPLF